MTKSPLLLVHLSFLWYAFSRTRASAADTGPLAHLHKPTETACLRVSDDRKLNSWKKNLGEMRLRQVSYVNSYATSCYNDAASVLHGRTICHGCSPLLEQKPPREKGSRVIQLKSFTQADANLTVGKSAIFQKHRRKIGFPTLKMRFMFRWEIR